MRDFFPFLIVFYDVMKLNNGGNYRAQETFATENTENVVELTTVLHSIACW